MNNIRFNNDNFILYSPDSLKYLTDGMEKILNNSLDDYKYLFNVDNFRKIQINYFDDLDEFRNYIYNLRGEKESLPEYAKGTFDKGMINAYIEPNIIKNGDTSYSSLDICINQNNVFVIIIFFQYNI